jgi:hypothetical protein
MSHAAAYIRYKIAWQIATSQGRRENSRKRTIPDHDPVGIIGLWIEIETPMHNLRIRM